MASISSNILTDLAGQINGTQHRPSNRLERPAAVLNWKTRYESMIGLAPGQKFVQKPHSQAPKFFLRDADISSNPNGIFAITIKPAQRIPHSRRTALQ
jgi:hypothetical protein